MLHEVSWTGNCSHYTLSCHTSVADIRIPERTKWQAMNVVVQKHKYRKNNLSKHHKRDIKSIVFIKLFCLPLYWLMFINLLLIHLKSHADNIHNRKLSNVEYSLILFHKVWEGKKRNQWLEGNLVQIVLKPGQKDGLNQRKIKIYVYVYVYGITLHLAQKMVKAERQDKKKNG